MFCRQGIVNVNIPDVEGSDAFGVVAVTVTIAPLSLSSMTIVEVALFTLNAVFEVLTKVMITVSCASTQRSSITDTGNVNTVAPAGISKVSGIAVKSTPLVAVPVTV